ncbi:hypothetical protein [Cohaesibacter celericrescens]|nr:hypothetical protein [Cohaesibacter celericrescens]
MSPEPQLSHAPHLPSRRVPSPADTAVINGKRYRWPSRYSWKQLSSTADATTIRIILSRWFSGAEPPVFMQDSERAALAFLKRANA